MNDVTPYQIVEVKIDEIDATIPKKILKAQFNNNHPYWCESEFLPAFL